MQSPDFESIKQISPYGVEYWSARDLAPLLGYNKWERFEGVIKRAMTACKNTGNNIDDHFPTSGKPIKGGKGAVQNVVDYSLSRFACYLVGQNGDPRKPEIAAAQTYFAISTRQNELTQLYADQQERLHLREQVSENNKALASAAYVSGVLSKNFGTFQNAGYRGLYGGLDVANIKEHKGIGQDEELLDRSGSTELAANDFRITQTRDQLRREGAIGEMAAMDVHHEIGKKVRKAIEDIGGTMPEELKPEPSLKPLIDERKRNQRKARKVQSSGQQSLLDVSENQA